MMHVQTSTLPDRHPVASRGSKFATGHVARIIMFLSVLFVQELRAQEQSPPAKEPPEPEEITIVTKDGVELHATWYASTAGPEAAAIILLHSYEGNRTDWRDFPAFLQHKYNHAVIVPDLRGHGESKVQTLPDGDRRELNLHRLRPEDFAAMVTEDVEAVKRFLIEHNDARELNIERLGIVGAGMGAVVGAQWATRDWAFDILPTVKQGRDVKALTLISPEINFKGLEVSALTDEVIRGRIAVQVVGGASGGKATRNAKQVYNLLRRFYHDPPADAPPDEVLEKKKLFLDMGYETSLQGTKMLGEGLGLEERIGRFLELQLLKHDYPWQMRKRPI